MFGVVSSQLTEGKVPLTIFGTATGILSVVGFLPDTFSSTWFGAMIDDAKRGGDKLGTSAYKMIFIILAVSAILAAAFAILLLWYVRRQPSRAEDGPDRAPNPAETEVEELETAAVASSPFSESEK